MSITYALPKTLVLRMQVCEYCGKSLVRHVTTYDRLHGIMACAEHVALAERDVRAWMCQEKIVRQRDFLEIHPKLGKLVINVPRTDGSMSPGGNISQEPWEYIPNYDGEWHVRVLFTDPVKNAILNKTIQIRSLADSGISNEELNLWINTLDSIYAPDLAARQIAMENGSRQGDREASVIKTAYVNGHECRVYSP